MGTLYTKSEMRRLDGFQAKCLRHILGIQPPRLSRVSNHVVLEAAFCKPASRLLLQKQLILVGKVLREPRGQLNRVCFVNDTLQTKTTSEYIRRVGRPRKEWVTSILPTASKVAGSMEVLPTAVKNPLCWKRMVKSVA